MPLRLPNRQAGIEAIAGCASGPGPELWLPSPEVRGHH
jgi:hypothetical protein